MRRTENSDLKHHLVVTDNAGGASAGEDVFEPVTVCFMTKHAAHVAVREVAFAALAQVLLYTRLCVIRIGEAKKVDGNVCVRARACACVSANVCKCV